MITKFGRISLVTWTTGLKERLAEKEIQMRQYRGLTKEGKWVYGYYVVEGCKKPKSHFIVEIGGRWNTVIPESVGQSTGIKDKNGTEIYEGDIIAAKAEYGDRCVNWVVMWWFERAQFVFGNGSLDIDQAAKEDLVLQERDEVIGNIHQNPELLEQGNG